MRVARLVLELVLAARTRQNLVQLDGRHRQMRRQAALVEQQVAARRNLAIVRARIQANERARHLLVAVCDQQLAQVLGRAQDRVERRVHRVLLAPRVHGIHERRRKHVLADLAERPHRRRLVAGARGAAAEVRADRLLCLQLLERRSIALRRRAVVRRDLHAHDGRRDQVGVRARIDDELGTLNVEADRRRVGVLDKDAAQHEKRDGQRALGHRILRHEAGERLANDQ